MWYGVCRKLFGMPTGARNDANVFATARWPLLTAAIMAVFPLRSRMVASAPAVSNNRTTPLAPLLQAVCRGVVFLKSGDV